MSYKKFDVIIFGASGCIGKSTVLQAMEVLTDCKWAIAGKSERKLRMVLTEISQKTGRALNNIPILVANVHDVDKLEIVVEKCKVLVNCCGPYQFSSENILSTCIIKGTHYVDMSNDPYFNELMELKYHEQALKHEVFIISSCGFHSLPVEVALNFLRHHFKGTINSVDAFARYNFGYYFYYPLNSIWSATAWLSLIWCCWKLVDLATIREELRLEEIPALLPKHQVEELWHRSQYQEDGIMVHIPFIDQQAVERSQYTFYARDKKRPVQFYKYIEFPQKFDVRNFVSLISSYVWGFLFIIWSLIVSILSQFERTRKILRNHTKLFSLGIFSSKGPIPHLLEMSSYKIKMCAKGWSSSQKFPKLAEGDNSIVDRYMNIEISGENPFYGCASVCLLLSAKTILEEKEKLPGRGGVFAPGYAFKNVNIVKKFQQFSNYFRVRVL